MANNQSAYPRNSKHLSCSWHIGKTQKITLSPSHVEATCWSQRTAHAWSAVPASFDNVGGLSSEANYTRKEVSISMSCPKSLTVRWFVWVTWVHARCKTESLYLELPKMPMRMLTVCLCVCMIVYVRVSIYIYAYIYMYLLQMVHPPTLWNSAAVLSLFSPTQNSKPYRLESPGAKHRSSSAVGSAAEHCTVARSFKTSTAMFTSFADSE